MSEPVQVALIGGLCLMLGPLLLAIYQDSRKAKAAREKAEEEARTEARQRAAARALKSSEDAQEALKAHLAEVTTDRDWWRELALDQQRTWHRGSVRR